jgi:hypothetical protein
MLRVDAIDAEKQGHIEWWMGGWEELFLLFLV